MYGILNLDWFPNANQTTPPAGRAPAIIRDDPYTHVFVVTGGWALLGGEEFEAQIRPVRLTGVTADDATVDFTVTTEQDLLDLHIILSLTATQTRGLPEFQDRPYWDLQQVDGGTLVAGRVRILNDVTRFVA